MKFSYDSFFDNENIVALMFVVRLLWTRGSCNLCLSSTIFASVPQTINSIRRSIVSNAGPGYGACSDERPVEFTALTGMIKSPGYDTNAYPNNAVCKWLITASPRKVRVITFSLVINYSEYKIHQFRWSKN